MSLESGQASTGNLQADGSFRLNDPLPVDEYKVYLAPKAPENTGEEIVAQPVSMSGPGVPSKYWNEASTDIVKQVEAGENVIKIELEKE